MSIYEKKMKTYRLGNIEVRKSKYGENRYEVVEWSKNTYYGKESEYEFDGEKYHPKDCPRVYIDPSCFKRPETCCTIANLYLNDDNDRDYIRGVGMRIIQLNDQALLDFKTVVNTFIDDFESSDLDNIFE